MGSLALIIAVLNYSQQESTLPKKNKYVFQNGNLHGSRRGCKSPSWFSSSIFCSCSFIFGVAYNMLQHSKSTKTPHPTTGIPDQEGTPYSERVTTHRLCSIRLRSRGCLSKWQACSGTGLEKGKHRHHLKCFSTLGPGKKIQDWAHDKNSSLRKCYPLLKRNEWRGTEGKYNENCPLNFCKFP